MDKTPDPFAGDPPLLQLALCQVATEPWAMEDNLERTIAALRCAAERGADLAITPECVLQGYPYAGTADGDRLLAVAEPLDGPRLARCREVLRQGNLHGVVGLVERGSDDRIYNTAVLVDREGELRGVYRKVHCRWFESIEHYGCFTPGDEFRVDEVTGRGDALRVGTMICFDREVPESTRCLRSLGAELIVCPLATDTSTIAAPGSRTDNEQVTRCRAAENEVFIAVVNHASRFNGGSFVVGPGGECLTQMGPEAGVEIVPIPIGVLGPLFHEKPLGWMGWGYRRPEVYDRYLRG